MSEPNRIRINWEDVTWFEVDLDKNPIDLDALSEEERNAIEEFNTKYMNEQIGPKLIMYADPCPCRMAEVMQKHQRRAQLVGAQNYIPTKEQDDLDAFKFSIITTIHEGKTVSLDCVIKECRRCHRIEIFGDSSVLIRLMAESFRNYKTSQEEEAEQEYDPNEIIEKLGLDPDEYMVETIGTTEDKEIGQTPYDPDETVDEAVKEE